MSNVVLTYFLMIACLLLVYRVYSIYILRFYMLQDLYCVRSDLGNLLKALARLDEAKVGFLYLLHIVVN